MVPVADLKKFDLFEDLPEDQVKSVAEITELKKYKRGEDVYRRGIPAKRLFLIKKGTVSLRRVEEHAGISFVSRVAGELLGTASLMKPQEYTLTGVCLEDSEIYVIDVDKLFTVFQKDTMLGYRTALAVARAYFALYENVRNQLLTNIKTPAIMEGLTSSEVKRPVPSTHPLMANVRVGLHEGRVRLVFDLMPGEDISYQVGSRGDQLVVTFNV
jgi:CRP/FNR family transcriptional regulator, cyclic AMP receptor protein